MARQVPNDAVIEALGHVKYPGYSADIVALGIVEDAQPSPDGGYALKVCLEAAEEYFLLTSNPNFERRQIAKNELLRKVTFTDWPLDEREARHWRAVADDLSSE